jgi:hypothetical protein
MPDTLKRLLHAGSAGWVIPLALLALPGCGDLLAVEGVTYTSDRGTGPHVNAVFCDVPRSPGRRCATAADKAIGIRLSAAAIALVTGQKSTIGLDDSPEALARCSGEPEAVLFQSEFPDGHAVCVDCGGAIGAPPHAYADANTLCVSECKDLYVATGQPGDPALFCAFLSHVSTNFAPSGSACYDGACSDGGIPLPDFVDPRRTPEPVVWGDLAGVGVTGTTLIRTAPTPPNPQVFDAGAASTQLFTHGDGYVEFTVNEVDKSRLCGLSSGAPPDTNPDAASIGFAFDLFKDGHIYLFEKGTKIAGPDTDPGHQNSFGVYQTGEKYRINVRDNFDGTAKITYSRVTASCSVGNLCPDQLLYTSTSPAPYPIRVDSSFHDQGATLSDVRVVRIR